MRNLSPPPALKNLDYAKTVFLYCLSPKMKGKLACPGPKLEDGAGHTFNNANAASVSIMILTLIFLYFIAGYLAVKVYKNREFFYFDYEQEHGESTIDGAEHGGKHVKQLMKKLELHFR